LSLGDINVLLKAGTTTITHRNWSDRVYNIFTTIGIPQVYTNVAQFSDWIKETMAGKTKPVL